MTTMARNIIFIGLCSVAACSPIATVDEQTSQASAKSTSSDLVEQKSVPQIEREAGLRMNNFKLAENFDIKLWADETQTQNPAYFTFDERGRMLMVETARFTQGVDDIRGHENKTVEDIYITSNADRLAMYEKYIDERPMSYYRTGDDIIRLIEDKDQDGRADHSQVFSDGYNDVLDGIGAGVISRDGKVYYTNIPHLWQLEDTDNDGVADKRESLQDGFGIRISFYGHDLHGLIWGPDGKLYWSIGDRGFNVHTKEGKHFYGPNLGGVFRANPDGSDIEYFYTGLRNPQELAFDDYGNLFTADNDGDGGDLERVNYLIEGGDSGWHAGHQSIMSFTERLQLRSSIYTQNSKIPNAWMTQEQYKPRNAKQPAFMLPAIGQLNGGPSGLVFNPGSSFGPEYEDNFFVIHYMGAPAKSYISSFTTESAGAGFKMLDNPSFLSGFNAVDLDFGPDGAMYISEYNYGGWQPENQGAVYRLTHEKYANSPEVLANNELLVQDFDDFSSEKLVDLLNSKHQRVRQRAQFALAKKQENHIFYSLASDSVRPQMQRLHAVWGLSQNAYQAENADALLAQIASLKADSDPQIRIQVARALGDHRFAPANDILINMLDDAHPRVAMYAAIGLGRIGKTDGLNKVIAKIKQVKDDDLFLRHALVMALSGMPKTAWWQYAKDPSQDVRMAVLLASRRAKDPALQVFLNDSSYAIRAEAITAINDLGLVAARPALAAYITRYLDNPSSLEIQDEVAQWQHHRVINANYAEGTLKSAQSLLQYASIDDLPTRLASEALSAIQAWNKINPIDSTTGLPTHANTERADIADSVRNNLPTILATVQGQALVQAMQLADQFQVEIATSVLLGAVEYTDNSPAIRNQAMSLLLSRDDVDLLALLVKLTQDKSLDVKSYALQALVDVNIDQALPHVETFVASNNIYHQQAAYKAMLDHHDPRFDKIIKANMTQLLASQEANGATIELLELARASSQASIVTLATEFDTKLAQQDVMTRYAMSLEGGDPRIGEQQFAGGKTECMRCHMINWSGGDVGPDLSNIGKIRDRRYLLQSLVDVNAVIAPGYGEGPSGMPPMQYLMSPRQIRDMVAYLASLQPEFEKVEDVH